MTSWRWYVHEGLSIGTYGGKDEPGIMSYSYRADMRARCGIEYRHAIITLIGNENHGVAAGVGRADPCWEDIDTNRIRKLARVRA